MKKTLSLIILIHCAILPCFAKIYDYGLHFVSYPSKVTEMTSLTLENGKPIRLGKEASISFDMSVRSENAFGTIFRIITNTQKTIDLLFTVEEGDRRHPIFVIGDTVRPINQEIVYNKWIPVTITFSSKNDEIVLSYGMSQLTVPYPMNDLTDIQMIFGQCLIEEFKLLDLASFNLKDVRIFIIKNSIAIGLLKSMLMKFVMTHYLRYPQQLLTLNG